ncbi:energy transducer TonB [Hymenobacter rigui]|uniref:Energy transducer TonB n=1 Tax=Hymenobacter rigui TaxID=334424 RepID=A0A428KKR7_9BACT|nr:energy transducer TonB [Hymenobacter rigui]RSK47057.1 energy transducer TonB [Hymenobacter rigui]
MRIHLLLLLLPALPLRPARAQVHTASLAENTVSTTASTPQAPASPPVLYHTADEMPAFPGGSEAFQKFLRKELKYPDEALRKGVSGRVFVRFVITDEGRIRDAEVVKGLGSGLDEEALRLVRIMPWWTPGRVNGQPVWVSYTLPIIFRALE